MYGVRRKDNSVYAHRTESLEDAKAFAESMGSDAIIEKVKEVYLVYSHGNEDPWGVFSSRDAAQEFIESFAYDSAEYHSSEFWTEPDFLLGGRVDG